ncbi:MAG: hypothetical protein ACK50L_01940 [Bacteroidota bacterium]
MPLCFFAQNEVAKESLNKNDSSQINLKDLRNKVAYAQINSLKRGALLVRLKTNNLAITKLKEAGNYDLATNLKRETDLENKIIISAYKKEFIFCPVYFFYSHSSDSVKKNNLSGIFIDSTLQVNPSIVCNATFYLIADQGELYNSSIEIIPESLAKKARESGDFSRQASIIIKNKYFIQLHKPFPFFQIKTGRPLYSNDNKDGLHEDIADILYAYRKVSRNAEDFKQMKNYRGKVAAFNLKLEQFYTEHQGYEITPEIKEYVY